MTHTLNGFMEMVSYIKLLDCNLARLHAHSLYEPGVLMHSRDEMPEAVLLEDLEQ